ncbi:MAG: leucine-rich repeat protein [Bacteroidaceae bacterium]|jgi:hypothetical protein|nr:leucine-rich repeat protein [Bacteroidaceae bacterium]
MKRNYLHLLLVMLFSMIGEKTMAYEFEVDGLVYNILSTDDKTVELTYKEKSPYTGDITVPSQVTYEGVTYTVTRIGDNAFRLVHSINSFGYNTELTSVTLPNTIKSLGEDVFYHCRNLTSIDLPNSIETVGYGVFSNTEFTSITIPAALTTDLKGGYFYNSKKLASIQVDPGNQKYNSVGGVLYDKEIKSLIFFPPAKESTSYTIPSTVTKICSNSINNCSNLTSITIPEGVETIEDVAFQTCTNLTSLHLPNSIKELGNSFISGCSSLKHINIPTSLDIIDYAVFAGASGLESISIPSNIKEIKAWAFRDCSQLKSIYIPSSVTNIEGSIFEGCTSLASISVDPNNPYYDSRDNCNAIIETETNALWSGCKNTIIPNTVVKLVGGSFYECRELTNIDIPSSVTYIGDFAFQGCEGLTEINIPTTVTHIGSYAFAFCNGFTEFTIPKSIDTISSALFMGCKNLKKVYLPETITTIESFAFDDCSQLESIEIPRSVSNIGRYAFCFCKGLTSITSYIEDVFPTGDSSFSLYGSEDVTLYVPDHIVEKYKSISEWNLIPNILPIPNTDVANYDNILYFENVNGKTGSEVVLSLKMKNATEMKGFQCDLFLPNGMTFVNDADGFPLVNLSTERTTTKKTDYFNAAVQADGSLRILCNSTKGYTFDGNDGEVATITIQLSDELKDIDYPIILKNIVMSDITNTKYSVGTSKSVISVATYILGDADDDGEIDVNDFSTIASYILDKEPNPFNFNGADVDADGFVDVNDLSGVVSLILYGTIDGSNEVKGRSNTTTANVNVFVPSINIEKGCTMDVNISIDNENFDFSSYQFDVILPRGIRVVEATLNTERISGRQMYFGAKQLNNSFRVLSASHRNEFFKGNSGAIATLTLEADETAESGNIEILNAKVAANGKGVAAPKCVAEINVSDATGISGIIANNRLVDVYDMGGRLVKSQATASDIQALRKDSYIINGKKVIK